MIDLLVSKQAEIAAACRRHRVRRLEAFGSAVTGGFDPLTSDVDLLVEFLPLRPGERADAYFGLLEDLQTILGRRVDLVMPRAIRNRYFHEAIRDSRKVLYVAAVLYWLVQQPGLPKCIAPTRGGWQ